MRCTPDTPPGPLIRVQNGQVTQIERRMASEQEMLARLHRARLEKVRDYYHRPTALLAPPPSIRRASRVEFIEIDGQKIGARGHSLEIANDVAGRVKEPGKERE